MSALYKTTVIAIGGRNGTASSDDGLLNLTLSLPKELGGKGEATANTNSNWIEQLSSSGLRFYYNTATNETSWSRPAM